jgi:hypothetical protein
LVKPGSSEGPLYACSSSPCAISPSDDPELTNRSGMTLFRLHSTCAELRSVTLSTGGRDAWVVCAKDGAATTYQCSGSACQETSVLAPDPATPADAVSLPAECGGRIAEVLVLGATTAKRETYVRCDASSPDGPLVEPEA